MEPAFWIQDLSHRHWPSEALAFTADGIISLLLYITGDVVASIRYDATSPPHG
jgi:hypothetical protein